MPARENAIRRDYVVCGGDDFKPTRRGGRNREQVEVRGSDRTEERYIFRRRRREVAIVLQTSQSPASKSSTISEQIRDQGSGVTTE